jgi:Anion-transporting ATPase
MFLPSLAFLSKEGSHPLARCHAQMQEKYLEQYDELYGEDMHVVRMPLLCDEVRGVASLGHFSARLVDPQHVMPSLPSGDSAVAAGGEAALKARVAELEAEVQALRAAAGQDQ